MLARSIIVISVPQPQIRHIFNWKGESRQLLVPPTYSHQPNREVEALLTKILESQGYSVACSKLPEKLLAVRSGLSFYGKNNICYVPGMGSFHRPMAFYTDLPFMRIAGRNQKLWKPVRVVLPASITALQVRFLLNDFFSMQNVA
jgi:hypothetical protein